MLDGVKIGEFKGFDLSIRYDVLNHDFKFKLSNGIDLTSSLGTSSTGMFTRMNNKIETLPQMFPIAKERLESTKSNLEEAKIKVNEPFKQADELCQKEQRLSTVTKALKKDEFLRKQNRQEKGNNGKTSI